MERKDNWIDEKEVEALGIANRRTLQAWRLRNIGPPFRKFGRSVKYSVGALAAWASAQPGGGDGFEERP